MGHRQSIIGNAFALCRSGMASSCLNTEACTNRLFSVHPKPDYSFPSLRFIDVRNVTYPLLACQEMPIKNQRGSGGTGATLVRKQHGTAGPAVLRRSKNRKPFVSSHFKKMNRLYSLENNLSMPSHKFFKLENLMSVGRFSALFQEKCVL